MIFTPKGEKPQWEKVLDLVLELPAGTIVTFAELEKVLGYDPSRPGAARHPIRKAADHLLEARQRTLRADRGVGYRVAAATEHEGMARGRQRSARRHVTKAVALTVNVDRNQLTHAQRESIDALGAVLMAQNAMLRRHDVRITDVEIDVQKVDDRVSALEAMLRAHGLEVPDPQVIPGETI
jgi:alkylated DNA nucleotide flippase Atl1